MAITTQVYDKSLSLAAGGIGKKPNVSSTKLQPKPKSPIQMMSVMVHTSFGHNGANPSLRNI
jgi:hypothetical protein